MRREVLAVSGAAARRLLRVRVAESAAVAATAAGLCSGAVQVAWLTAAVALPASVGICVLVAAGGVLPLLPPVRRALRLGGGVAGCLAGICLAAGVAGAACVLSGWHARVGQVVVPAVLFPLGGLVGAAVAAVRGVSPRRAAGELDARCRLAEQLATATELAESPPPEGPAWLCVYERALAAVRGSGAARGRMWSRTGATPGALLLTALLCAILSFVPPFGHIHDGDLAEFAAAVEEMPLARRMRLARSLRAAAGSDPKVAEMLAGAAAAVEDRDAGRLAGLFRRLRAAGVEPMSVVPPGLARVGGSPAGARGGGPGAGTRPAVHSGGPDFVRVYDPRYAKVLAGSEPGAGPATDDSVRYEDAWQAARRRAADVLDRGEVPHEYRRVIRAFFAAR